MNRKIIRQNVSELIELIEIEDSDNDHEVIEIEDSSG